jgi:hypothetical protein
MSKTKSPKQEETDERIPFDDALRQILKAPPAHKTSAAKKSPKAKTKRK